MSERRSWPSSERTERERIMDRQSSIAALVLAAAIFVLPAQSQEGAKKDDAVKPVLGPSQAVLESWNDVGRKLIAMAEDFPENKYDYKPNPAERSFAEQLLHAANSNYFFTNPATGQRVPAGEDPKRDQFKSKAEVVAFVKKAFA